MRAAFFVGRDKTGPGHEQPWRRPSMENPPRNASAAVHRRILPAVQPRHIAGDGQISARRCADAWMKHPGAEADCRRYPEPSGSPGPLPHNGPTDPAKRQYYFEAPHIGRCAGVPAPGTARSGPGTL